MYCGNSLPPHCVQICLANQHDIHVIQSFRAEAFFEVNHPTLFTLKLDRDVSSAHPMINALHPSVVLVPTVPLLILNSLDGKLPLAETFVPTRGPTAAKFAEVCAEYSLHPPHRHGALGAIAALVPPTAAFVI